MTPMTDLDALECQVRNLERELAASRETLRDRFAMAALTGLLAKHGDAGWCEHGEVTSIPGAAATMYEYADAMMEARKS